MGPLVVQTKKKQKEVGGVADCMHSHLSGRSFRKAGRCLLTKKKRNHKGLQRNEIIKIPKEGFMISRGGEWGCNFLLF